MLQDIKLVKQGDIVLIDIDFGLPLLYQKHFPQKFGEILQVQLSLNEDENRRIHKEVRQANDIQAPAGLEGFLIYVTYEEGVPGGPYLTLRFSRAVNFEVRAGSSLESLTIAVTNYEAAEGAESESLPGDRQGRRSNQAVPEEKVDEMMAKARQTLTFGDAEGAIDLLRKIVRMPENKHTQDARELLGLALERSNQIPRAKFEYKKYLQLYKKGEGPERVKQRLLALQNLGLQPKKKLRRVRREDSDEEFKWFGHWSQSYHSYFVQEEAQQNENPDVLSFVASRIITSNLSLQGRLRGADSNMQTVFSANHLYDFIDRDKTDARVSYFNFDYDGFTSGVSTVVGRQRARNSGVFERFDGVIAGYRISDGIKPYFYAGKPVSFFDSDLYDKKFWGSKVDFGTNKDPFGSTLYYMHQLVDDLHDREAVGTVLRFTKKTFTAFALFDYDLQFKEMIAINSRLGWQLGEKIKLNTSFNRRSDLTLSKAVRQAQSSTGASGVVYDLTMAEYFNLGFTEEDIANVARAFSITQENWTVGATYQLDKDRQFNLDFSVFSNSGYDPLPAYLKNSSYIDTGALSFQALRDKEIGSPGTENQYQVQAQWISTNTFVERDLHVLGTRYSRFSGYQQASLYLNSRLPPYLNWNPRPRLNLTQIRRYPKPALTPTTSAIAGETMVAIEPSLKVDYRWKRAWVFDAEIGLSFKRYSGGSANSSSNDSKNQTLRIGYNYTF